MAFRTVFVKNSEKLSLKLDNLVVHKEGQELYIPLIDIENIILEGDYTTITTRILAKLAFYNIDVVVCDNKYLPCGIYLGLGQYHRSAKRNAWQSQWNTFLKQNAWTEVVTQKIQNQISVAIDLEVEDERIKTMQEMSENILLGDASNREGHVAKMYFNSIFGMGFTRDDDTFPNACLNYGYSVIRAQVARHVVALGLIPSLGIFHKNEYNAFNLVDDLMEPFRPLLDWYVYTNILNSEPEYLCYDKRIQIIDFLNQRIYIKNKKTYINNAIADYINSFILSMEQNNFNHLLNITFEDFKECK